MKLPVGLAAAVVLVGSVAVAAASPPRTTGPGNPEQVAALVAASASLSSLPSHPDPTLQRESSEATWNEYPVVAHCTNTAADPCVFGERTATRRIVLLGDSHAAMWLPAVLAAARTLGDRVVLVWTPGCPAADVVPYDPVADGGIPEGYDTACTTWRTKAIATVRALRPTLVLLSDRTSLMRSGPGAYFTAAKWRAGLEATIRALAMPATRVAVLGDIDPLSVSPESCLATHPHAVQSCSAPYPDPAAHSNEAAERAAAAATGAGYVRTLPWVCTTRCSAVIGDFLPYLDATHLDVAYVSYLGVVMTDAIRAQL